MARLSGQLPTQCKSGLGKDCPFMRGLKPFLPCSRICRAWKRPPRECQRSLLTGRENQVPPGKRMFESWAAMWSSLKRMSMGSLRLDLGKPREYRPLAEEIRSLGMHRTDK